MSVIEFDSITVIYADPLPNGKSAISIHERDGKPRMLVRGRLDQCETLLHAALGGTMRLGMVRNNAYNNGKNHHAAYKEHL